MFPLNDAVEAILARASIGANGELDPETVAALDEIASPTEPAALLIEVAAYARGEAIEAEAVQATITHLNIRKSRHQRRHDAAAAYVYERQESMGEKRLADGRVESMLKRNPPSVEIVDDKLLPEDCWRVPPTPERKPDKVEIKARLTSGADVPGARLVQTNRLEIK